MSKYDVEIATKCPLRIDNHLDIAINDGKGHSKVIPGMLPAIGAYGNHLFGPLNS